MSVTIDIVEGAQLDHAVGGSTLKRIAYVDGLDNGVPADPAVMIRALAAQGLPQWYQGHPSDPSYTCNRHIVNPSGDSACRIDIYYVRGPASPAASTWLVTESTTGVQEEMSFHPGTGENITVLTDSNQNIAPQLLSIPRATSLLRLTFEGWISRSQVSGPSTPTQTNTDAYNKLVNSVNAAPWRGYDVGYWLFAEWDDSTQDRGFSYTIRASFLNRVTRDWSEYGRLRDPNTGKVIAADPKQLLTLMKTPYYYGVLRIPCVSKVGPYPPTDFIGLFGT